MPAFKRRSSSPSALYTRVTSSTRPILLEVEVDDASPSCFWTDRSADMMHSTFGLFIATHRRLPVHALAHVSLQLPATRILGAATIRWTRDASSGAATGLGVTFEELSVVDWAHIVKFCERRPPFIWED